MSKEAPKTATINITRIVNAPRAQVWKVWTDPAHISKWWGPKDFTGKVGHVDLKEGGTFHYCMHGPAGSPFDQDMWSGGEYLEIVPMEKIVCTDYFADAEGNKVSPKDFGMPGDWPEEDMVVTVTFEDAPGGKTKLTLKHEGHPVEMAKDATMGWNQSLDKFEAALS